MNNIHRKALALVLCAMLFLCGCSGSESGKQTSGGLTTREKTALTVAIDGSSKITQDYLRMLSAVFPQYRFVIMVPRNKTTLLKLIVNMV